MEIPSGASCSSCKYLGYYPPHFCDPYCWVDAEDKPLPAAEICDRYEDLPEIASALVLCGPKGPLADRRAWDEQQS